MSVIVTRTFSIGLALLALAACGRNPDSANSLEEAEAGAQAAAAEDGRIACALGGAAAFSNSCTVERDTSEGALMLTIRHADGGFRRFRVEPGKGVVAADGAEPAAVTPVGPKLIEVSVGGDKYRLPATVKSQKPAEPAGPAAAKAAG
jgi:hypothetical protein